MITANMDNIINKEYIVSYLQKAGMDINIINIDSLILDIKRLKFSPFEKCMTTIMNLDEILKNSSMYWFNGFYIIELFYDCIEIPSIKNRIKSFFTREKRYSFLF